MGDLGSTAFPLRLGSGFQTVEDGEDLIGFFADFSELSLSFKCAGLAYYLTLRCSTSSRTNRRISATRIDSRCCKAFPKDNIFPVLACRMTDSGSTALSARSNRLSCSWWRVASVATFVFEFMWFKDYVSFDKGLYNNLL